MQVTGNIFDKYVLSKFLKISKLATDYAVDNPLWSSVVFDKEGQRILYIGWRFSVALKYPVEEDFIVNFHRFRDAVRSCNKPTIRTTNHYVIIEEENVKFKLKKLDLDYSNFLFEEPEDLEYKSLKRDLLSDIEFCSVAASRDKSDYMKYGVLFGDEIICGMDKSYSSIALILTGGLILDFSILIHLPWCEILQGLGEITEYSLLKLDNEDAMLFLKTKDQFKITFPVLRATPNPSILSYIQSIESHVTLYDLNKSLIKKLEVTTDDAYKFCTVFSDGGKIFLETSSKTKGKTTIEICDGDMLGSSVGLSLQYLSNVVSMAEFLDLDLENMVGFISINDEFKYAFSLG